MPVEQQTDWYQSRPKGWPRHGFEKRLGAVLFGALVMFVFGAWVSFRQGCVTQTDAA
ncbi:MAG: hypothetical protein R2762_10085 [Bryobacteraceae bacterium]